MGGYVRVFAEGWSVEGVVVIVVEQEYIGPIVGGEVSKLAKFQGVMVKVTGKDDWVGVE